ncbi:uncharacterized protein DNG_08594 [Cephalotrichum gorgonifer]|uniref:DUF2415 domain-containing protein n=1 Tax=Cephalotrichum gorgonifer TaxID=2041049 RepID=A0AAE8N6T1_9PEZI|nr:uncharacterized protein DNG_08594 [Cephalotrichum gorgonifer]
MQLDLDPDSRLLLDLDSPRDAANMRAALSRVTGGSSSKTTLAKSMKLVRDRVNCISLWFPPVDMPAWPGAHTEPIAVLANNDKTVALVNLEDFDDNDKIDPCHTITYPDFVNRAVISPDGRLLVAVLDDPYLYVHERVQAPAPSEGGSLFNPQDKWEYRDRYLLKSQRRDDVSQSRGSFAVCFSNSGAFLAVGTQYGTISIFDATAFTDPSRNPVITTFQSSRPEALHGAVRDMAFCPGPYDLLAWTEDKGRVGIADLRSDFVYRQIVDLTDREGIQEVAVSDENAIDPRLLARRHDRDDSSPPTLSNALLTPSDRRRGGGGGVGRSRHELPLLPNETRILEAMQDGRRRREQRAAQRAAGIESGSRHADESPSSSSSGNNNRGPSTWAERAARRAPLPNESDMATDPTGTITRAIFLLREGSDQAAREQERNSTTQRANTDTSGDPPLPRSSRGTRGEAIVTRFDDLDALYSLAYGNPPESRNEGDTGRRDRTPFVAFLSGREWDDLTMRRSNLSDQGIHQVPPLPDNTSGLSWSEDGRILYVGAENGIYEFRVNVLDRKLHPSIMLR